VAAAFARAWSDHKKEATINRQPAIMALIATSSNSSEMSATLQRMEKVLTAKQWQCHRQQAQ